MTRTTLATSGLCVADTDASTSALWWDPTDPDLVNALSPETAWRALTRTFGEEANNRLSDHVKLIANGSLVTDQTHWPTPSTGGALPDGWDAAGQVAGSHDRLFVYARAVQAQDRLLFSRLTQLLMPVFAAIGVPRGHVEAEVFYGRYRDTPGGIHREGCTNFHLVLQGRKSMFFWTGEQWLPDGTTIEATAEPEQGNLEQYLPDLHADDVADRGHVLTATVGHGFFWRSGVWHVGRTHEPGLALNLATYTRTLDERAGMLPIWTTPGQGVNGRIPAEWFSRYRAHVGHDAPTADRDLLAHLSALHMRPAPTSVSELGEEPPRAIRRILDAPLVWLDQPDGVHVATLGAILPQSINDELILNWLTEAAQGGRPAITVPSAAGGLAWWLCEQGLFEPVNITSQTGAHQ